MDATPSRPSTILSLDKALHLFTCFTPEYPEWSLSDMSRRVGMPKPTVMRLAHTLEMRGFLTRTSGGKYRLGFELVRLGHMCLDSLDFRKVAEPLIRQLCSKYDETTYLAIWQGQRVVYILRADCSHPLKYHLEVGSHVPFHAGSAPKAIAAFLSEEELGPLLATRLPTYTENTMTEPASLRQEFQRIRQLGYATSKSEVLVGVSGVSSPVFGSDGHVLGAIAVSIPSQRVFLGRIEEIAEDICMTAETISRAMGYGGSMPRTRPWSP